MLAQEDPLTGLSNRRGLLQQLERIHAQAVREGTALSVFMLDIDHFKNVNDTLGHAAGDLVLRRLAALLKEQCRVMDVGCRWGGEEFLVVAPHCGREAAVRVAEKVRLRVAQLSPQWLPNGESLTVSIGVASDDTSAVDLPVLLQQADDALYEAKRTGRNRVCHYSGLRPPDPGERVDRPHLVWTQAGH